MNSMERSEEDSEIEKLTKILSSIQNLYDKKKVQLEELQLEISELKNVLNYINSIVSNKSFHSADEIYNEALNKLKAIPIEDYFKEEIEEEKVKGTKIKRKIFSENDQDLLCVLNFIDFREVIIKFINPVERSMKETSEDFISTFLRVALVKIKEKNPTLKLNYNYFKNTDIIENIKISNLTSINEYDLITSKIRELLSQQITSNTTD
jgi:hypothetical protein